MEFRTSKMHCHPKMIVKSEVCLVYASSEGKDVKTEGVE